MSAAPQWQTIRELLWALPAYVDRWRIVPRALMAVYLFETVTVTDWFMKLAAPNSAQSAVLSLIWGAGAAWFALYLRKPGAEPE